MRRAHASAAGRDDGHDGGRRRRSIAVEAARLISEQGIRDYAVAKRKAAERLGFAIDAALPKNTEVEEALREHQRLFAADEQPQVLRELRETAREALQFFAPFDARLVGSVLDGSADRYSAVCLHVFADEPEALVRFLGENGIPFEEQDRELRLSRDESRRFPAFVFSAGGTPVDLTVFPADLERQAPLDRSGDKPMARANLAMLDALLAQPSDSLQD